MMKTLSLGLLLLTQSTLTISADPELPTVDADGTVHMPAFAVPLSRYMSEQAKREFIERARKPQAGNSNAKPSVDAIAKMRASVDDDFRPVVERVKKLYPVNIEERKIGGVRTHVIQPKEGVCANNRERVLINLHGGGFAVGGGGIHGMMESIPVSGMGKIKVVTVDYRMAPEYSFPAASEDVASVYAELLKQYHAENIGIYGCSAGGVLTAMAAAWFQKEKLPAPGALGIFSAGAYASFSGSPSAPNTWGGDSRFTGPPLMGSAPLPLAGEYSLLSGAMNYTNNVDVNDPLASPALSPDMLAKFPPTLLVTGTRAYDMSAAVQTQRELTKAGVEADLHLWDGLEHCFFLDQDIPETKEAYAVITKFFDSHLGKSAAGENRSVQ